MSGPDSDGDTAPIRLDRIRKRRALFRRYAELLSRELEAARRGDLQEVDRIGERRSALHEEVSERFPPIHRALEEADGSERRLLEELRSELKRCQQMNDRLHRELRELRTETLDQLDESQERPRERAARAYLAADSAAEAEPEDPRDELNVTVGERPPPSPPDGSSSEASGEGVDEESPRPDRRGRRGR